MGDTRIAGVSRNDGVARDDSTRARGEAERQRERVLVAMSGGVDSSVAAAMLAEAGHEVVGVTLKLWGGPSDSGCCSVSDVDDARRVAQQIGIDHLVFNFADEFSRDVVEPYVGAHAAGITPNPCIECNRSIKFDRLIERARLLGFDRVATGHYAQIGIGSDGHLTLERGSDHDKDQSYVLHMLNQAQLAHTLFPVGHLPKSRTRELAAQWGLRTAAKPDSQDVCFIAAATGGRETFLGDRIPVRPGTVIDIEGNVQGSVDAVELVTVGQRRGLGLPGGGPKRYVVDVDVENATVIVGGDDDQFDTALTVEQMSWVDGVVDGPVLAQCSAHGAARPATAVVGDRDGDGETVEVRWDERQRRVAPGQSVVLYDLSDRRVLGGGLARRNRVAVASGGDARSAG